MTTNYVDATDEIYTLFKTQWDLKTPDVLPYVPEVRYGNNEKKGKPPSDKFWVRITIDSVNSEQTSLSTCAGKPYQRRYTDYGLVFVQVFCPKSVANSDEIGKQLASIARATFRGVATPGQVWFRNARINDLPPEDLFYRFNVVAEYEYDELQ